MLSFSLDMQVNEEKAKEFGGLENYKELLFDILTRYGNEEYFNPELMEQARNGEDI